MPWPTIQIFNNMSSSVVCTLFSYMNADFLFPLITSHYITVKVLNFKGFGTNNTFWWSISVAFHALVLYTTISYTHQTISRFLILFYQSNNSFKSKTRYIIFFGFNFPFDNNNNGRSSFPDFLLFFKTTITNKPAGMSF